MCRLFGFRSAQPLALRQPLLHSSNSLLHQSGAHRHGWGIGWWEPRQDEPRLVRSARGAAADPGFSSLAESVEAPAAIAHAREASVGRVSLGNAHPFTWGSWLFAHNGTIPRFSEVRGAVEAELAPAFRSVASGETDSSRCFALFLTRLSKLAAPEHDPPMAAIAQALGETVAIVAGIADAPGYRPSATNFLVGNGRSMLACRRGRTLFHATRLRAESGHEVAGATVPRLLIASEDPGDDHLWEPTPEEEMVGIDSSFRLHRFDLRDWGIRAAG
ncbi:class II glutamine amidotransferase [Vulgatibacter incomptus]|uniref:class II glutamine amidotransferase n=1 Tax=Vulgatibacter incomptus TaxID=1391653 RepID=UPI001470692D|nr:class II glutamine amidotransferase [Vulgatibacter incomptus]